MTEQEFLSSEDPQAMLEMITPGQSHGVGKLKSWMASDRKLRLFAVACCRSVWHLLTDEHSRHAVNVAERFADKKATNVERLQAYREAAGVSGVFTDSSAPWLAYAACGMVDAADAARQVSRKHTLLFPNQRIARLMQANVLRDIVGNPFQPVVLPWSPCSHCETPMTARVVGAHVSTGCPWLTETVVNLATTIYESRDFGLLPILADALEDVGVNHVEILTHCRGSGLHVRGCWVVDLILGKS